MLQPGYQKHCQITNKGTIYTFSNFRDFSRTSEDNNQIQNRTSISLDSSTIKGMNIYICPFMWHNWIGHTIIEFLFTDNKTICLTVESELQILKQYSIIKGFFPGYRIRYIRGSPKDIINLRIFRHEKVYKYPIHLDILAIQNLFQDLVKETNKCENKPQKYNLIFNNCTSGIRKTARKHLSISKRHYSLLFNTFLPNFLQKLGVVKLSEKKEITKKI